MLDNTQLEFFRKKLELQKNKILKNLNLISLETDAFQKGDRKDEGDLASLYGGVNTNKSISKRQSTELKEIEKSLKKIENSSYGICEMCEDPIILERLKVKPFAEYCIVCREFIESNNYYQFK